jgi:hypothetical protein
MAGKNYRDLIGWQRAMDFAVAIYEATKTFPQAERFRADVAASPVQCVTTP